MSITLQCPGDGVTDVTACFQQAINSASAGATLSVPFGTYLISSPLVIRQPINIVGEASNIRLAKGGIGGFQISSSGVTLDRLNVLGTQSIVGNANEVGIQAIGPSAASPLANVNVLNCGVSNLGMYGMLFRYVTGFNVEKCPVSDIFYGGLCGESVINGEIKSNQISNITGQFSGNAYGILLTRLTTDPGELVTNPFSSDILVEDNVVSNVPHWEGIDTHAGRRIAIRGNRISGCNRGIVVCDCPNSANVHVYGPKDCLVKDNIIDSGVTDGSAVYGITVSGCSSGLGIPTDLADGCDVSDNIIRGYGNQANPLGMALYLVSTRGLKVVDNTIIEPGNIGIGLYYNNYDFIANTNTICDPWSNVNNGGFCIKAISDWNRGLVDGNSYVRGSKQATYVLGFGLYIGNYPNNWIGVGKECDSDVPSATRLYDVGGPGKHTY